MAITVEKPRAPASSLKGETRSHRRLKRLASAFLILLSAYLAYSAWASWNRDVPYRTSSLNLANVVSIGADKGAGNLVSIAPWTVPRDYSSQSAFHARLDSYFAEAKRRGWLGPKTIVVLPEYLGTWLVAANEKADVYSATSTEDAMKWIAASNLPAVTIHSLRSPHSDRIKSGILGFKAQEMARIYDRSLSDLARTYRVTIVGGSIVLPSPSVEKGHLVSGTGPLYNASAVYGPDGLAMPGIIRKCFPTKTEAPYTTAGRIEDLPVFETPAGRLGVLICADSWFPEAHRVLREKRAQIVASPTFGPDRKVLDQVWRGYSGWPNPKDVDPADPGKITERQAMLRYGLGGRLSGDPARSGMTACLSGKLWDIDLDSLSILAKRGRVVTTKQVEGASLVNMWLDQR